MFFSKKRSENYNELNFKNLSTTVDLQIFKLIFARFGFRDKIAE